VVGRLVSIAALAWAVVPARALAWGSEGHLIIAALAQKHLTPQAAASVRDLLGGRQLADVALWADDIKASARPETRPWHYVLIPDGSPAFDDLRDCPGRNCVVDAITDHRAVLKDYRAPRDQRVEALEFLVHYVADLHQPLHCEDRGDDLSHEVATTYPVRAPGDAPGVTSLLGHADFHVVWDTGVVQTAMGQRDVATYAAQLDAQTTEPNRAAWSAGTPEDWANESHHIAQRIYAELAQLGNQPHSKLKIGADYGTARAAVLEQQLERAGVRLAAVLDDSLPWGPRPRP
jgi:hypothetical protein